MTKKISKYIHLYLALLLVGLSVISCTTIQPAIKDTQPLVKNTWSNELFDRILKYYVDGRGLVDYTALRNDPDDLEEYYYLITIYSPDSHPDLFPSENHALAYWINAYNATAIKTVLTHYPVTSVLDVKQPGILFFLSDKSGFFFFQRLTFGGKTTSLYYLENQVIRKRFGDPRIHFALNCASLGCPRLPRQSFSGESLDRQLDNEARLFLSESRNFRIDHEEKVIYLSSIFKWYEKDFTSWYNERFPKQNSSLLSYIELYLASEKVVELKNIEDSYTLRFIPYDWQLNDQDKNLKSSR